MTVTCEKCGGTGIYRPQANGWRGEDCSCLPDRPMPAISDASFRDRENAWIDAHFGTDR